MILRYLAYLPVNLLFVGLAYLLSPFLACASVIFDSNPLPGRWQWFSTLDADLDGGMGQGVKGYKAGLSGWRLWWQRTCWICRNPAHGWQSRLLGMPAAGTEIIEQWSAKPLKISGTSWRRPRAFGSSASNGISRCSAASTSKSGLAG